MATIKRKMADMELLEGGGAGGMGGGSSPYKMSNKKPFDAGKDAENTLMAGFGIPLAASGLGVALSKKSGTDDTAQERREAAAELKRESSRGMKQGGAVRSSASRRADGIAQRGKTRA